MIIAPGPESFIRLEVNKTGLMKGKKHVFDFPAYRGKAERDPNRYEITLDARRIECKDDWLKADDLKKVAAFAVKEMLDGAVSRDFLQVGFGLADHSGQERTYRRVL